MIKELFGSNLKKIRNDQNLTREKLAEIADVSADQIYKLESGNSFVSASMLEKLSNVLNVEPYEFFIDPNKTDLDDLKFKQHKEFIKSKFIKMIDEEM